MTSEIVSQDGGSPDRTALDCWDGGNGTSRGGLCAHSSSSTP